MVQALSVARHHLESTFCGGYPDFANYRLYFRAADRHLLPAWPSGSAPEPWDITLPIPSPRPSLPPVRVSNPTAVAPTASQVVPPIPGAAAVARVGRALLTGGMLVVLLMLLRLAGALDPIDAVREELYGWRMGPLALNPDLVLVDLDARAGSGPWSRQALATLVDRLVLEPPVRGVVFDLRLGPQAQTSEPQEQAERATRHLAETLKSFLAGQSALPRVVALARGGFLEPAPPQPGAPREYLLRGLEPLAAPLEDLPWGYAVLLSPQVRQPLSGTTDRTGVVRGVPLAARVQQPGHAAHGMTVFALASLPFLGDARSQTSAFPPLYQHGARLALSGGRLFASSNDTEWIRTDERLRVEIPNVPEVPLEASLVRGSELLQANALEGTGLSLSLQQRLAGKLAVVGYVSQRALDRVPTLWGERAGVQVQAGLLSALYDRRAPWRFGALDVVLQGLVVSLCLLLCWRRGRGGRWMVTAICVLLALEGYCWYGLDLRLHTPVFELGLLSVTRLLYHRQQSWQTTVREDVHGNA